MRASDDPSEAMAAPASSAGVVRSTAALGLAAAVQVVCGLLTSKVAAVTIGPAGVGRLALVQALGNLLSAIVPLGVGQALVRYVGLERGSGRHDTTLLFAAARLTTLVMIGSISLAVTISAAPLASVAFGDRTQTRWIGASLFGGLMYTWVNLLISELSARGLLRALVMVIVFGAVSTPLISIPFFVTVGSKSIPLVYLLSNLASLIATLAVFQRQRVPRVALRLDREVRRISVRLVRYGVGATSGFVLATLVAIGLPLLAARRLGLAEAGYFRAAHTVVIGLTAALLYALNLDYPKRVSEGVAQPSQFSMVVNMQTRIVLVIGVPAIWIASAAAAPIIDLLFTARFIPAVVILRWMLVGQILVLILTSLTTALSAFRGTAVPALINFGCGAVVLVGATVVLGRIGAVGLGIGFVVGNVVAVAATAMCLRLRTPFTAERSTRWLAAAGLVAGAASLTWGWLPFTTAAALNLVGVVGFAWTAQQFGVTTAVVRRAKSLSRR